ncbi:MAG: hypothetical protein HY659_07925 [Rhizobiales bacterium]|nr:hypothetical protein [Hyphomicrobiales bacterium]
MALAVALGIALVLAFAWQTISTYWLKEAGLYTFVLAALAGVWVTNFFMILPLISPDVIHLVPYSVSLLSKLLFGLVAAAVLSHRASVVVATRPT